MNEHMYACFEFVKVLTIQLSVDGHRVISAELSLLYSRGSRASTGAQPAPHEEVEQGVVHHVHLLGRERVPLLDR